MEPYRGDIAIDSAAINKEVGVWVGKGRMSCAKQSRRLMWLFAGDSEPRKTKDRGAHIQRSVINPAPLLHQRHHLVVP